MAIATINPATGETLKTYEPLSDEALEEKIARAAAAWDVLPAHHAASSGPAGCARPPTCSTPTPTPSPS